MTFLLSALLVCVIITLIGLKVVNRQVSYENIWGAMFVFGGFASFIFAVLAGALALWKFGAQFF